MSSSIINGLDLLNPLSTKSGRLLLDRIIIQHDSATIRVKLVWRFGGREQQLLMHRPCKKKRRLWTESELEALQKHYETASLEELMGVLPGRSWAAIKLQGQRLGLSRKHQVGRNQRKYTPEEDELIRRYYASEISQEELLSALPGRTVPGISNRARRLGLTWQPRKTIWERLDNNDFKSCTEVDASG